MSEIGETFKALKKHQKDTQELFINNELPALLKRLDDYPEQLSYTTHNSGLHYIIKIEGKTIDLWPTTQRWRVRKDQKFGKGILKLLKRFDLPLENSSRFIMTP